MPDEVPPLVDGPHDLEALTGIVQSIESGALKEAADTIAFRDLNLRFTTDRHALSEVLRRIIDGRIRPASGSVSGRLGGLRFCRAEVDAAMAEARRGPGLTVQQVAHLTGWKEQCIAAWCSQDLIQHEVYPHAGRTGRMITVESLLRFQATYLPLSDLARQMGTTSRWLIRRLGEVGVQTEGSFQDGQAWRGHLVAQSAVLRAGLGAQEIKGNGVEK